MTPKTQATKYKKERENLIKIKMCLKEELSTMSKANRKNGRKYLQITYLLKESKYIGTSLVVQWLRLHAPNAGELGLIPGQGTRSHMLQLKSLHVPKKIKLQVRPGTTK